MTSPSSWGREAECLASVILPNTRSSGPGAVKGSAIHAYLCAYSQATTDEEREEALLDVEDEYRPMAAAIDWSRMPAIDPESGIAEVAVAWSPSTGRIRELGRGGSVEHDDLEGLLEGDELGGIADWVALLDDAVFVTDFKTGYSALAKSDVSPQLRAYGFLMAKLFGREKAIVSYCRLLDNGGVVWDVAEMDTMKLMSAEAALRQHLRRVVEAKEAFATKGVIPPTVEGEWCRWCPAFRHCGAKRDLLQSALEPTPGGTPEIARLPNPLDHDTVSRMWPRIKAAKKLLEQLDEDMRDYVRIFGAVKLPNGNTLGEFAGESRSIDPTFARPVLEARFGKEWADYTIKVEESITFKALDDLAKNHSSHGKKAKLLRTMTAELDAAGAIRVVPVRNVTEVSATSKKLKQAEEQPQLEAGEPLEGT